MISRHINPFMVCMLVIAQAMAGVGHAGLMVCREDNRTSRIELSNSGCCGEADAIAGMGVTCETDQLALPVLGQCGEGDCLDEPIELGPALTRKQFHEENRDIGVPIELALSRPTTTLAAHSSDYRADLRLVKCRQSGCDILLRTVVLIV